MDESLRFSFVVWVYRTSGLITSRRWMWSTRSLLKFLFFTSIRVSELVHIKVSDVDLLPVLVVISPFFGPEKQRRENQSRNRGPKHQPGQGGTLTLAPATSAGDAQTRTHVSRR